MCVCLGEYSLSCDFTLSVNISSYFYINCLRVPQQYVFYIMIIVYIYFVINILATECYILFGDFKLISIYSTYDMFGLCVFCCCSNLLH